MGPEAMEAGDGTLSARIMDAIGRRIVAGHYRAGTALPTEPALCDEYRVSRTPLREAVKRLHAKGLVAVGPRAGTRVLAESEWNQLDPDLLRWRFAAGADGTLVAHLYELRVAFEPEACRLAALNGRADDHAAVAAGMAAIEATQDDLARTVEADIAFHTAIIAATRNPFMISVGSAVRQLLRFSFTVRADRTRFPPSELAQHRRIADAVLARDGEEAAAGMRALLGESRRSLTAALERGRPALTIPEAPRPT
jgi:DNA-binding FadR family transcriptional regulator